MMLITWMEFTLIVCVATMEAKKESSPVDKIPVEKSSVEKSSGDKISVDKISVDKSDVKSQSKEKKGDKNRSKEEKVDKVKEKGSYVDKHDAKFWSTVDLRKLKLPKPVNDIGSDYVIDEDNEIAENSTEIDGNKMYFREARPKGRDSGQVSIQQKNIDL